AADHVAALAGGEGRGEAQVAPPPRDDADAREAAPLPRQDRRATERPDRHAREVVRDHALEEALAVLAGHAELAPPRLIDDDRAHDTLRAASRCRRRSLAAPWRRRSSSVARTSGGTGRGRPTSSTATNVRYALVV